MFVWNLYILYVDWHNLQQYINSRELPNIFKCVNLGVDRSIAFDFSLSQSYIQIPNSLDIKAFEITHAVACLPDVYCK